MPTADVLATRPPLDQGARALAETLRPLLWPYVVGNTLAGLVASAIGYQVVRRVLERRKAALPSA
jgi:hypothetical protein